MSQMETALDMISFSIGTVMGLYLINLFLLFLYLKDMISIQVFIIWVFLAILSQLITLIIQLCKIFRQQGGGE